MTTIVDQLAQLRDTVRAWKLAGQRVAFVPTMGNLHAGHFSLVRLARTHADRVVASVFVNPTQFGPNEDYGRYPRTPDADAAGLDARGCDLLFLPPVEEMYPFGTMGCVQMHVPGITDILDGYHRPGHFNGVAQVVARLLNMVQPQVAVFGRKDYQQLQVIRYMTTAMSSRNQYLQGGERDTAVEIYRTLRDMQARAKRGETIAAIEEAARSRLQA